MSISKLHDILSFDESNIPYLKEILDNICREATTFRYVSTAPAAENIEEKEAVVYDNGSGDTAVYYRTAQGNLITLTTSRTAKNSIEIDGNEFQLINDEASPGNLKYYGTGGGGSKGYFDLPQSTVELIGSYVFVDDTTYEKKFEGLALNNYYKVIIGIHGECTAQVDIRAQFGYGATPTYDTGNNYEQGNDGVLGYISFIENVLGDATLLVDATLFPQSAFNRALWSKAGQENTAIEATRHFIWKDTTNEITAIRIYTSNSNRYFKTGSTIAIYGYKTS